MVVMLANSLYRRGFIKEGSSALGSIYKMATAPQAKIYPLIPEYFNNEGRGLYLYLTGSASWYIYTLVEEILGIQFILGDITLSPKLMPLDFFKNKIEVKYTQAGKTIKISYRRGTLTGTSTLTGPSKSYKIKEVFLENKKLPKINNKYTLKKEELQKIRNKEVQLKVELV